MDFHVSVPPRGEWPSRANGRTGEGSAVDSIAAGFLARHPDLGARHALAGLAPGIATAVIVHDEDLVDGASLEPTTSRRNPGTRARQGLAVGEIPGSRVSVSILLPRSLEDHGARPPLRERPLISPRARRSRPSGCGRRCGCGSPRLVRTPFAAGTQEAGRRGDGGRRHAIGDLQVRISGGKVRLLGGQAKRFQFCRFDLDRRG